MSLIDKQQIIKFSVDFKKKIKLLELNIDVEIWFLKL